MLSPHLPRLFRAVLLTLALAVGASPLTAADRAALIGQPTGLIVHPPRLAFTDARAGWQLVVSGQYPNGQVRDLTAVAEYAFANPDVATLDGDQRVTPLKNGATELLVRAGNQTVKVPVEVRDLEKPRPVSFRREVVAALNVGGCNMGACHGTPSGKNGFRLSLRGYDPDSDLVQLTRDVVGRRTDALDPDQSLILLKGAGRTPHEGGQRYGTTAVPYQVLRAWIAEGLRPDPANLPAITKVEVVPGDRVQLYPANGQQLAVVAHLADGSARDVTPLANYSTSDPAVADVDRNGRVTFKQPGEAAILIRYLETMVTIRLMYLKPDPGFKWPNPPEANFVDQHVFAKLKLLNLPPSDLCTDGEFLRRAYLDVLGVLPTAEEARAFLAEPSPGKRGRLIERLLTRPEFADFWTLKWADVFRANRKTMQLAGVHKFHDWLHRAVAENRPFDAVVRELLTASGSTFSNPAANYYRAARDPQSLAETTAQLFLGARMQCAKCHNHPFERWTQDDYYSLAAFFARVKFKRDPDEAGKTPEAELIYLDRGGEVTQPRTGQTMAPKFPGGAVAPLAPGQDRREALADWLTKPENPFFAKSVVNRLWFHLLGKGIVDPVDDFRDSNPPANAELLDALAKDFAAHGFDVKHTLRVILNSRTYQLSAQPNDANKDDTRYFSHAVTKLLTAEQLLDAICFATAVPEKFAGLPAGTRATQLPDGEVNHVFLKTFGQPARELACECERESDSNLAQALQLINGPTIHEKLRNPTNRIGQLTAAKRADKEMVEELYLATLSRQPDEAEIKAVLAHVAKGPDPRRAWEDVQWALINAKEFLFRH